MKFNVYKELPADYALVWKGDFKENNNLFLFLNLGSFFLLIPFVVVYYLFIFDLDNVYDGLFLVLFLSVIFIIIHELIHGMFFKMGNSVKVKYKFHGFAASASVPDRYLEKRHYLMVGLAPAIIINLALFITLFFVSDFMLGILYWTLALHFVGCIGDFYIAIKLIRQPKDLLIRDYGIGMEFYHKSEMK